MPAGACVASTGTLSGTPGGNTSVGVGVEVGVDPDPGWLTVTVVDLGISGALEVVDSGEGTATICTTDEPIDCGDAWPPEPVGWTESVRRSN